MPHEWPSVKPEPKKPIRRIPELQKPPIRFTNPFAKLDAQEREDALAKSDLVRERISNLGKGPASFDPSKRQLLPTSLEAEEDFDLDRRLAATKQTGLGSGDRTIHKETLDEPQEFERAPSTASFSHLKPAKRISEPEIASLQSLQDNKRSLKDMSLEERRTLAAERLSKRRNSVPPLAA